MDLPPALDQRQCEFADPRLEPADAAPHGRAERRGVCELCGRRRRRGGARGHHCSEFAARRSLRDGEEHLRAGAAVIPSIKHS